MLPLICASFVCPYALGYSTNLSTCCHQTPAHAAPHRYSHTHYHPATVEPPHNGQPQHRHSHTIRICTQKEYNNKYLCCCNYLHMQHLGRLPYRPRLMSHSCDRQLWHFSRRRCLNAATAADRLCGSSLPQCILSLFAACCCNTKAITLHAAKSFRCGFVCGAYTHTHIHRDAQIHTHIIFDAKKVCLQQKTVVCCSY